MQSIPIIDISECSSSGEARRAIARRIDRACRDVGFFYVRGHGVDERVISSLQAAVVELFELPWPVKQVLSVEPGNYRGYIPFAAFGDNVSVVDVDHYEGYKLHREVTADDPIRKECRLYAPNRWPEGLPGFRETVLDYWRELDTLSGQLLRLFALALGLEETHFLSSFMDSLTNMTLLHYPRMERAKAGSGIHPHRDIDAFTILHPGEVPGLEVLNHDQDWVPVDPLEGTLVVNLGIILELWSGGRVVSTPHRTTNPSATDRYSFPYFATPRYNVLIEPLLDRLPGFDRPAVEAGVILSELFRTNWKTEAQTDPAVDVGEVG